jgi:molybdopterin molybdotransferase
VKDSGIAKDDIDEVIAKLYLLKDSDLLIISGGSSKGERDLIVEAVKRIGGEILFHGVNIKPGKPFFYASVWGKPLFGLPGHPLSCAIILHRFVLPLFLKIVGCENQRPRKVLGELTNNVPSSYGVEEYVNVKVRNDGKRVLVDPLFAKSAAISVFSISSGYIVVDEAREGFEEGEEVEVFLYEL